MLNARINYLFFAKNGITQNNRNMNDNNQIIVIINTN